MSFEVNDFGIPINPKIKKDIKNIKSQLEEKTYYFDTVADMKSANLSIGDCVITKGFYSKNDGGGAIYDIISTTNMNQTYGTYHKYKIRNSSTVGVGNYLNTEGTFTHILNNGNVAEIVIDGVINIQQIGARGYTSINSSNLSNYIDSYSVFDKVMWLDHELAWTIDLCGKDYYCTNAIKTYRNKTFKNGRIYSSDSVFTNGISDSNRLFFDTITAISTTKYAIEITDKFDGGEYDKIRYTNCRFNGYLGGYYSDGIVGFNQIFIGCGFASSNGNGVTGLKGPGTYCVACDCEGIPNGALLCNCFDMTWYRSDSNAAMKHAILYNALTNGGLIIDGGCNFEHITNEAILFTGNYCPNLTIRNASFSKNTTTSNPIEYIFKLYTLTRLIMDNVVFDSFTPSIASMYIVNSLGYFKFFPPTNNYQISVDKSGTDIRTIIGKFEGKIYTLFSINSCIQDSRYNNSIITGEKYMGAFFNSVVTLPNPTNASSITLDLTTLLSNSINISDTYTTTITDFKDYGVNYGLNSDYTVSGLMGYGTMITITNKATQNVTINYGSFVTKTGTNLVLAQNNSATFIYTLVNNVRKLREI